MMKKTIYVIIILFVLLLAGWFVMQESMIYGFTLEQTLPEHPKWKLKVTMGDMKAIGRAIESFIEDWTYAPKAGSIQELAAYSETSRGKTYRFSPFYIRVVQIKDAWEHDFFYKADGKDYWIGSGGSDGQFKGFDQQGTWDSKNDGGRDIVFSNGKFVYGPDFKE